VRDPHRVNLRRVLVAVAVVGVVVLGVRWRMAENRAATADRVKTRMGHVVDSLEAEVARLKLVAVLPPSTLPRQELSASRIAELRRAGLPDPERNLRDSLLAHPELIPYPSTAGGMIFFENTIVLLPESAQIWAYFEDGHSGGTMLLEYWVEPGVKVHWKVLWSRPL
jgi:hypothetical protein